MAQSIDGLVLGDLSTPERTSHELWRLRLILGWIVLFGALVGLFALSWDIQWHTAIGRDRTLTAPHLFILGSIAVMGLAALLAVLIETFWTRREPAPTQGSIPFAGLFRSSLGTYLVGYGALASAIAFPIDQYWHTLYGVDVSIWAPFHIMALTGLCIDCLGVAYMLAEGAHQAALHGAKRMAFAAYVGVLIALATLMGVFSYLLQPSLNIGYISRGGFTFTVYPLMLGVFGILVLSAAMRAVPWRMAATLVAVTYLFFGLVNYLIIPPLMNFLLGVEQQHYLPDAPTVSVVAIEWQYGLIVAAVLLDGVAWIARRRGWSLRRANKALVGAALIGMILAAFCFPPFLSTATRRHNVHLVPNSGIPAVAVAKSSGQVPTIASPPSPNVGAVVMIIALSLLPGLPGAYVGNWLGTGIGEAMRREE